MIRNMKLQCPGARTFVVFAASAFIVVGCRPPETRQLAPMKAITPGAETPEKLAERYFAALQANDLSGALSTMPTEEVLRRHLEGDADLPGVLELNSHLVYRGQFGFAKIVETFHQDRFDVKHAKIAHIDVELRESGGDRQSFGQIVLHLESSDPQVAYEIEFDDGMKIGDRWYFTDHVRELRRITLL